MLGNIKGEDFFILNYIFKHNIFIRQFDKLLTRSLYFQILSWLR